MSKCMGPSRYNPWNLGELKYEGELYHYTKVDACRGIFSHSDCPGFPANSISLRFSRIDKMAQKNDPNERKHIDQAVKKLAQQLSKRGKISNDFLRIICDYEPTYSGFYRLALDEIDYQFYKPQHRVLIGFGPVDYYVLCFSTNPNNEHIIKEFKTSVRIAFNANFSRRCADLFSISASKMNTSGRIFDCSNSTHPLQSIRTCFLNTYMRQVEYIDTSADVDKIKSYLIGKRLMRIYKEYNVSELSTVQEAIEDMYSLCDAFVKDVKYKPEEEVRFVIRLPQKEHFLKEYGQFPELLTENHFVFNKDRTYLQLPISDEFVAL